MIKNKASIFLSIAFLVLAGVSISNAQVGFGSAVRFKIAEPFMVKDKSFAPGNYSISQTPSLADASSVMILRGDNGQSIIFDTNSTRAKSNVDETKLVFDNINGTLFLSKIFVGGDSDGIALSKTSYERKMIAAADSPAKEVVVTTSGLMF